MIIYLYYFYLRITCSTVDNHIHNVINDNHNWIIGKLIQFYNTRICIILVPQVLVLGRAVEQRSSHMEDGALRVSIQLLYVGLWALPCDTI